ncbi:hypothetical protein HI914_00313 [Erysiphe necator]|uniref:Putative ubiquitin-protein ligase sel1 protein n=1 Tax=Uncinula necator TaxID=52586 RepID=A0A0B1PFA8_UNCNE|nr:hypothetical protein HI914_00313 [Erysiphe necator]KHJ36000.1 putative ubiquitin-protein ligase sel1 protein [Erysiphe necator]
MAAFIKRQFVGDDYIIIEREPSFWWTKTGQIVRWSVFLGLFTLLTAYIVIGYFHAKRRMKKGLPLLAYHRWLVSREERAQFDPSYSNPSTYYYQYAPPGAQNGYGMQPMPPPVYDPNAPLPPSYQTPMNASKLDASQWNSDPTVRQQAVDPPTTGYQVPTGPPPVAQRPN